MSLNIGELVGYIKLDGSGVGQGIRYSQRLIKAEMPGVVREAEKGGERAGKGAGDKLSSGFGKGIGKIAAMVGGVFAVQKVVGFFKTAADSASDLNETANFAGVIFPKAGKALEKWAETADKSLGLSKQAALDAVATFGDMFQQLGLGEAAALKNSKAVVQLAADLGSFKNLSTEDVLQRIQAGFRGEYDSLQLLIPNINAARVEQEALNATHKTSAKDLTAAEKATATLAIVQKDGAKAAGDFARTSDGAANSSKIAKAEAANLTAELGQKLLPAYIALIAFGKDQVLPFLSAVVDGMDDGARAVKPMTDALGGALGVFKAMPGPLQASTVALLGFLVLRGRLESMGGTLQTKIAGGANKASSALDTVRLNLMYAGDAARGAESKLGGVAKAIGSAGGAGIRGAASGLIGLLGGPWGLAFTAATAVVTVWISKHQEAKRRVAELTAAIEADSGAIREHTRAQALDNLESEGVLKAAKTLGLNLKDVTDAALGNAAAQERVNEQLAIQKRLTEGQDRAAEIRGAESQAGAIHKVEGAIAGTNAAVDEATAAARRKAEADGTAATKADEFATAEEKAVDPIEAQAKAAKDAAEAILDLADAQNEALDAAIGYEQALDDVNAAVKENGETATKGGKALDINTQAGRDNASALNDLAKQAKDLARQNLETGVSVETVRGGFKDAREEFIKVATKMGLNETAAGKLATKLGITTGYVDGLVTSLGKVPAKKETKVKADTRSAMAKAHEMKEALADLRDRNVTVTVDAAYSKAFQTYRQMERDSLSNADGNIIPGRILNADGNVLHFQRGAEDHRAFIARPGTPQRIFNEPETGGEAYIPLATAKRPRSTEILRTVAEQFGFMLAPKSQSNVHNTYWNVDRVYASDAGDFRRQTMNDPHRLRGLGAPGMTR